MQLLIPRIPLKRPARYLPSMGEYPNTAEITPLTAAADSGTACARNCGECSHRCHQPRAAAEFAPAQNL